MTSAERNKLLGTLLAGLARDAGMQVADRSNYKLGEVWVEAETPEFGGRLSVLERGDGFVFGTCSCCTDPAYARCLDLWTSVLAVVNRWADKEDIMRERAREAMEAPR